MVRTAILVLMAVVPVAVEAGVPMQINHQGVVSVDLFRFDGTGFFRFAIIDPGGVNLWTNDGTREGEVGVMPDNAVNQDANPSGLQVTGHAKKSQTNYPL